MPVGFCGGYQQLKYYVLYAMFLLGLSLNPQLKMVRPHMFSNKCEALIEVYKRIWRNGRRGCLRSSWETVQVQVLLSLFNFNVRYVCGPESA